MVENNCLDLKSVITCNVFGKKNSNMNLVLFLSSFYVIFLKRKKEKSSRFDMDFKVNSVIDLLWRKMTQKKKSGKILL